MQKVSLIWYSNGSILVTIVTIHVANDRVPRCKREIIF